VLARGAKPLHEILSEQAHRHVGGIEAAALPRQGTLGADLTHLPIFELYIQCKLNLVTYL
jgi:hypothetical protein